MEGQISWWSFILPEGFFKIFVTTHVVRLKGFRLKAEGDRKAPLWRFGEETADFCIKHGFKVCSIPIF